MFMDFRWIFVKQKMLLPHELKYMNKITRSLCTLISWKANFASYKFIYFKFKHYGGLLAVEGSSCEHWWNWLVEKFDGLKAKLLLVQLNKITQIEPFFIHPSI